MDRDDRQVREVTNYEHPWGGTVIRTEINQPTYNKVVSERFGWEILDFSNAVAVNILGDFSERISEAADWLTDRTEDSVFISDAEAVSNFFLVHTFSSAVFEAVSYLLFTEPLCYVDSEEGENIVAHFDEGGERSWYKVENASTQEEKRIETIKRVRDGVNPSKYLMYLEEYLDFNSELLDHIGDLYDKRGSVVHNLMGLMKTDWKEVKAEVKLWEECVSELIDILESELAIHQGLYQGLND
jgi:hypothetical protein